MHPNPAFRQSPEARNLGFARETGFGLLCVGNEGAPLVSHIPFLLSEDGKRAEFHLVRSNPIVRNLSEPRPARLAVQGPHSYVSPDWYGIDDQVPTWNYIAVHLTGRAELTPEADLHDLLDRQSALFEPRLAPKPQWTSAKMSDGVMERMMRQIVAAVLHVEEAQGTWKLNQNKSDDVRLRAADAVERAGMGAETAALAALMRAPEG
ncbi:MAG: FMN-binding negative transcriptional regulator [Roseovarius sp.]